MDPRQCRLPLWLSALSYRSNNSNTPNKRIYKKEDTVEDMCLLNPISKEIKCMCLCARSSEKREWGREKEKNRQRLQKECGVNAFGREERVSDHCPAFSNQLYLVPLCCVKPRSYGYVLLLFSLFTFYASKEQHKQLYVYLSHQQLLEKRILSATRIVREQVGIFPRQPRI